MNQYTPEQAALLADCIRSGQVPEDRVAQLLQDPQVAAAYERR